MIDHPDHIHVVGDKLSGPPIIKPFPDAQWFGCSSDQSIVGWTNPATGTVGYYRRDGSPYVAPDAPAAP